MIEDRHFAGRRFSLFVLTVWLFCSIATLVAARDLIAILNFRDPDDALRLVQIRDWMAGQSWFDVTQYRINPPAGGPMHWSRLIDVPIAALLSLATPLAGPALAEKIVLAAYPLLVLGLLFTFVATAVRRLAGAVVAAVAVLLLALTVPVLIQLTPMRIDHHGWQIVMGALALYASLLPSPRKSGVVTGIALTFWLNISSEALPYAALFGALYALRYLRHPEQWERLAGYLLTIALGSTLVLLGTHGWPESLRLYCDAMSPAYIIPLWAALLLLLGLKALLPDRTVVNRLAITAVAGAGALIALTIAGRKCLAGPFASLDPFVYQNWYLKISEGLPIWDQSFSMAALILTGPVLGLAGYGLAIRAHRGSANAATWMEMLFLALGALVLSLLVLRAMSLANLYMLPGNAWLLLSWLRWARGLQRTAPRILASVATMVLIPVIPVAVLANTVLGETEEAPINVANASKDKAPIQCTTASTLRGLAALPPATLFAPLDIGPFLLVHTHHSVIATNHHRNQHAMAKVMWAFMSPPDKARAIVSGTGADYLVYCPERSEISNYVKIAPYGLAARLQAGKIPVWLQPVPMRRGETIRVYRVED